MSEDEVDTFHAWDCTPAELTAEIERLSEENKRLRELLSETRNAVASCEKIKIFWSQHDDDLLDQVDAALRQEAPR